jgi:regulator of extracellular matrix RemA (YlzA/DUF370 family)
VSHRIKRAHRASRKSSHIIGASFGRGTGYRALGFGDSAAWIESVVVATQPVLDPAAIAVREDALAELYRVLGEATADAELIEQLELDIGVFTRKLPAEVRAEIEDATLKSAIQPDYPALIIHVRDYLNARLMALQE